MYFQALNVFFFCRFIFCWCFSMQINQPPLWGDGEFILYAAKRPAAAALSRSGQQQFTEPCLKLSCVFPTGIRVCNPERRRRFRDAFEKPKRKSVPLPVLIRRVSNGFNGRFERTLPFGSRLLRLFLNLKKAFFCKRSGRSRRGVGTRRGVLCRNVLEVLLFFMEMFQMREIKSKWFLNTKLLVWSFCLSLGGSQETLERKLKNKMRTKMSWTEFRWKRKVVKENMDKLTCFCV